MTDTDLSRQSRGATYIKSSDLDPNRVLEIAKLRRRRRRVTFWSLITALLMVAIPGGAAYRIASLQPETFEAQADVLVNIERAQFGEKETIMTNNEILAERRDLAATVADQTGSDLDEFIENRAVDILDSGGVSSGTSSILRFKVRNEVPAVASAQVELLVQQFIEQKDSEDTDEVRREAAEGIIDDLQERRVDAQDDIERAERIVQQTDLSNVGAARRTEQAAQLNNDVLAARGRYEAIIADLNTQVRILEQLEPDGISVTVSSLGPVFVETNPVEPQPVRSLALGLAVGVVLAVTFLFITFQLRSR